MSAEAVVYQVVVNYSTVPTRYDSQINTKDGIDWQDYADPTKAPRDAHQEELEFVSAPPSEGEVGEGQVEDEDVLEQLRMQVCDYLNQACPGGYDLDSFSARIS